MEWRLGPTSSSWSAHGQVSWGFGGNALEKNFLAHFVAHCESYAQVVENTILWLGFVVVVFLEWEKNSSRTLYFSLIIVKFLQLRGRRQIAKPRKYYLMCVIVFFFWHVFSLFFLFLTGWEFRINYLQFAIFFSQQNNCFLHNKSNIYPDIGLMYFSRIHGLPVSIKPNPVGYLMLSNYYLEITPSDHACWRKQKWV